MSIVHKQEAAKGVSPDQLDLGRAKPPQSCCTAQKIFCYRWWTPLVWILGLILVTVAIAVPVLLETKPWQPDDPSFQFHTVDNETYPFISVDELVELMASEKGVTLLDAREAPITISVQAGLNRNIPGFQRSKWTDFMDGDDLKSPEAMAESYRARGVMNERPVVVYGGWAAANFWGEEGRVWWHLHWLDHPDARVLYGGIWAWDSGIHEGQASALEPGDFKPSPVASRLISTPAMLDVVQNSPNDTFIIDVRARNEYDGEAPFGSEYGGHIGGAFSYPWRTVFDAQGNLRPLEDIRGEILALDTRGYDERRQMILYCTRGVRASFAVATLVGAGFTVTMHEGSWQEWTEQVPQDVSAALQAAQG